MRTGLTLLLVLLISAASTQPAPSLRDCDDCPEMVVIPAGDFSMGSPETEAGRMDREGPQRRVRISRFAAGKFEVTRGQWAAFASATKRNTNDGCFWTGRSGSRPDPIGSWRDVGFPRATTIRWCV